MYWNTVLEPSHFPGTPFFTGFTPASGTLGTLDPSNLFDGIYTIQLDCVNSAGAGFVDPRSLL